MVLSASQRVRALLGHLHTSGATPPQQGAAAMTLSCSAEEGTGPPIPWAEIRRHNTMKDLWVVVHDRVFDMTDFIKEESGHPGGADIPLEYGGKDASDFWTDMHGHMADEILEDVLSGELRRER